MRIIYNGDSKVQAAYHFEGFDTRWTPPMLLMAFLREANVPFDLNPGPNDEYLVTPKQSPIVIENDPFDPQAVTKAFAGLEGGEWVAIRWQDKENKKWVYHLFEPGREED